MDPNRDEILRPIVTGWLGKIERSKEQSKSWREAADECRQFFASACGFMWEDRFKGKFWSGTAAPKFRLTINKAFELVAQFGPMLYAQNPHRNVTPRTPLEIDPMMFGNVQMDPMALQIFQQTMQELASEGAKDKTLAELFGRILNYMPGEQPFGGLKENSITAINRALITGRGILFTEPYRMPGSDRLLVGSFDERSERVGVDPDSVMPDWSDAKWMYRECTHPVWQVAQEYGLDEDWLKDRANQESGNSQGEREGSSDAQEKRGCGKTFDMLTYYKIWSKGGVGARLTDVKFELKDALEQLVGPHAYLVVAKGIPFPLNAPIEKVRASTDEDISAMFRWPIPFWRDDRWACSKLDFYTQDNSPYPIPPLAPGLGELKFINTMVSHLCNRIWTSSRDFWVGAKAAMGELEAKLRDGKDQSYIGISDILGGDIDKTIKVLQQPQTNFDVWRILEAVMQLFDKRVGLTDLVYGLPAGGVQSRTAEDAATKRQQMAIRPEYMADRVEDWQTEAARMELLVAATFLEPQDVQPILGRTGAYLWQSLVMSQPIDEIVRELHVKVAAGSARKPNKDRDAANFTQIMNSVAPVLSSYASATTDTNPFNNMIGRMGKVIDQDLTDLRMGPWMPPPPPMPVGPDGQPLAPEQAAPPPGVAA